MKTRRYLLGLTLVSLLALPTIIVAAVNTTNLPNVEVIDALNKIVNLLYTVLLVVAALFIVIAAFTFITAGGDPEKVNKARDQVMYAVIGVIVALLAKGLVWLVTTLLTPTS